MACYSCAVVASPVDLVAVPCRCRGRTRIFRELFGAVTLAHTHRVWVQHTTRPLNHVLGYRFVELRMFLFVGQLCTNEAVVVVGGARFVLRCQYQQDMRMWKASLLVFDDVHIR